MKNKPVMTGACCPQNSEDVTQLSLGARGGTVGIRGLDTVFEQLLALGWTPVRVTDSEFVGRVRAERNYIPSTKDVEKTYAAALRRAYAAFYTLRTEKR